MSRRVEVLLSDDEYEAVADAAQRQREPIARVVRESLRQTLAEDEAVAAQRRIAAVLEFASFEGPTGDIERILEEIGRGRSTA